MIIDNSHMDNALQVVRFLTAYILLAAALVLSVVSIPVIHDGGIKISFLLMVVYYWSIYRPTLVPVWMVFIAGVFVDALTMMPLGVNALVFLGLQRLVVNQRRFLMAQPFLLLWLGFALVQFLSSSAFLIIYKIFLKAQVGIGGVGGSWLVSVLLFPFMYILLHLTHKLLPSPKLQGGMNFNRGRGR